MAGCARPVRMTANSSLATATAFSIFSSASRRTSSITAAPVHRVLSRRLAAGASIGRLADQRADLLPAYCSHDVTLLHQVEDNNGQAVVHAQAHRCRVHDLQAQAEHLAIVKLVEPHRPGHLPWISIVDPVHLGALEQRLGPDLQRPLGRARIGREEGGAEPRPEDHDPALLQVPDRPAGDVGLGHLAHRDRGLDPGVHAQLFQHILQRETVDNRAQHAHVVGPGTVDAAFGQGPPAEHVAAAHHGRDLDPVPHHGDDLAGDAVHHLRGDAQRLISGKGLAGQLDYNPSPRRMHPLEGSFRIGGLPGDRADYGHRAVPPPGAVIHRAAPQCLVVFPPAFPQPALPTSNKAKPRAVTPCSLSICLTVFFWSLTNGCSISVTSLKNAPRRPSTILGIACSGLPSSRVICSTMFRSFSTTSAGTWSRLRYRGRIAATCWASSLPACSFGASSWTSAPMVGGRSGSFLCR